MKNEERKKKEKNKTFHLFWSLKNNRKGFNDILILMIILFIFIGTAIFLPFINEEFNQDITTFSTDDVANQLVNEDLSDVSSIGAGDVLLSLGKIFFWTFGDLPFWLDIIFLVMRIILLVVLLRIFVPFLGSG